MIKRFELGDIEALYYTRDDIVSFTIVPRDKADIVCQEKLDLTHTSSKWAHIRNESLVQLSYVGDIMPKNYSNGHTYKNSTASKTMRLVDQEVIENKTSIKICTTLKNKDDICALHEVIWNKKFNVLEICVSITNNSDKDKMVEYLPSFNISNLSPFMGLNSTKDMKLHEMKSNWSAEAKLVSRSLGEMQLEDSWSHNGARIEKIQQIGSMPARNYMPFMAIEDTKNEVTWAVSLCESASWQLEAYQSNGCLSLSGGIADYQSGHYRTVLKKGKTMTTSKARLTCISGSVDDACYKLVEFQELYYKARGNESDLPIVYNEYCYSWGNPIMENLKPIINEVNKYDAEYFVVDAGWYVDKNRTWHNLGDWNVSKERFPNGFVEVSNDAKKNNMKSGIWFEFEVVTKNNVDYEKLEPLLITRDKIVINDSDRCFLDFRKKATIQYLDEKVIKFLQDNNVGYMKVDYNECLGIGCDDKHSFGNGLKEHMDGVVKFFKKIKKEVPNLILEVCSSGGHRIVNNWLEIGDMMSFSDAHEVYEGAIICANLHRVMMPKQMQIWSTMKEDKPENDIIFLLNQSFYGRMCLSGDIPNLSKVKLDYVKNAVDMYKQCKHIIKDGTTIIVENDFDSYRYAEGVQKVIRHSKNKKEAIVYINTFNSNEKVIFSNEIFKGKTIQAVSKQNNASVSLDGDTIEFCGFDNHNSCVLYVK